MSAACTTKAEERDRFEDAHEQAEAVERHLRSAAAMQATHTVLEAYIQREGREWMRRMMQAHLDLRAGLERRVEVVGAEGLKRTQLRVDSHRPLRVLFGDVEALRLAYQAPGVEGLHPLDASLQLPEELYSYGVRRLVAEHVAHSSYEHVVEVLARDAGLAIGKHQVEQLAIRAAQDFEAFYATRTVIAERTSALLALTFDGAGIIMRQEDLRPATQKAAAKATRKLGTRLTRGEKRNRKRMAEVSAIYTVEPFPRTVSDVVHGLRPLHDVAHKRPQPINKKVAASVVLNAEQVIRKTFEEALRRDPERRRRWVALVDGNKDQIAIIRKVAKEFAVAITLVIDLMHVLEYLWKASYSFHAEGSTEAEEWVTQRLIGLLQGQSGGYIARGIRRNADAVNLGADKRKAVNACARYLVNNTRLMHYDRALEDGLPISTGVIEGACRYIVRDRMDRTGARWSLTGAEAVLRLRALVTNEDFEDYWAFHLAREYERIHVARYADGSVPCPLPPARGVLRRVK
jgi:hypothetical protein